MESDKKIIFSRNSYKDILRLVFGFVAFVVTVASSSSVVSSVATSGSVAGSGVGILSNFFIGNNLHLILLRTFSLVLNNDPKLFKKLPFLKCFHIFIKIC